MESAQGNRRAVAPSGIGIRRLAPVLIPMLLLGVTGLRGVDYGEHWDEYIHIDGVENSIESGVPLPGVYPYPSASYWLMMIVSTPSIVAHVLSGEDSKDSLLEEIRSDAFSLRARSFFTIFNSLAVLFVYLTVLIWRDRVLEALLASTIFGLSWEYAYHARYIAPDCVGVTFGSLALLGCIAIQRQPERRSWLWIATLGAGLAFASKWPLGLYLVPLMLTGLFLREGEESLKKRLLRCATLGMTFFLIYLISTPGTILDYSEVENWIVHSRRVYVIGHFGYTVKGGIEHLLLSLEYLLLVFPSPMTFVSIAISIFAFIGLVSMVRESWRLSSILLSCPILYLLFVCNYNAMHVRNLLIIGPILAILAARGIADACDLAGERLAPVGIVASVALLIVINGGWLVYAGETIRAERSKFIGELAAYTDARPESFFFISPMLCEELAQIPGGKRFNYSCDPRVPADAYVYLTPEVTRSGGQNIVPSNRRNLNLAMFGPHEVNLDYYSSWPTNRHIRISGRKGAEDMGFPFVVDYKERARQKHKAQPAALERYRRQQSRRARPGQGQ